MASDTAGSVEEGCRFIIVESTDPDGLAAGVCRLCACAGAERRVFAARRAQVTMIRRIDRARPSRDGIVKSMIAFVTKASPSWIPADACDRGKGGTTDARQRLYSKVCARQEIMGVWVLNLFVRRQAGIVIEIIGKRFDDGGGTPAWWTRPC